MMCNDAAALALTQTEEARAPLTLAEAVLLNNALAREALNDPDFSQLDLRHPGKAPALEFKREAFSRGLRGPEQFQGGARPGRD
jgi:hypothetical protein